ncbi:MAG: hemerythrin domain-containing protein [Polyangiaceae bacterium]
MASSDRFRSQHDELYKLALEIDAALSSAEYPGNAREVRRMMARLKGKLVVHSTMENDALYPRLLQHPDPVVRGRARAMFDDLGHIYEAVGDHHGAWSSVERIQQDPRRYADHTREIFAKLHRRMERENDELYPLADREEDDVPRSN